MSERALRGTRLGATSYETDSGIDLAPRQDIEYSCPNGHRFEMPFSLEADVPAMWECRVCGAQALRVDGVAPEEKQGKPSRTHWDMLMERRTTRGRGHGRASEWQTIGQMRRETPQAAPLRATMGALSRSRRASR